MVQVKIKLKLILCCVLMAGVCTSSYAMYHSGDRRPEGDGKGVRAMADGSGYCEEVCDSREGARARDIAWLSQKIGVLDREVESLSAAFNALEKQRKEPGLCDSGVIWCTENVGKISVGIGAALTTWGIKRNHPWKGEAFGAEVMALGALAGNQHPALVAALACYGAGIPLADATYVLARRGVISKERAEWFADHHRIVAGCLGVAGALVTWAWRGLAKRGTHSFGTRSGEFRLSNRGNPTGGSDD